MIKLIVPLRAVPLGALVTKRAGTVKYEVVDRIRIFAANEESRETIHAKDGVRFFKSLGAGQSGTYNAYPGGMQVVWEPDRLDELFGWLHETYGPTPK